MVVLVTKVSVRSFVPGDSVIEGLTKCVLTDVLSTYSSDKEFHREINQVLRFLIHNKTQMAIALFEAWLNRAIEIL